MPNLWRNYEWVVKAIGRPKGRIESLSAGDTATATWLRCGWIKEVGKKPTPVVITADEPDEHDEHETKEVSKAPKDRSLGRSAARTK